tara:strand:+ start:713 stop:1852 length:1140 start_codon:yes stop_codon:yes gene_type:complete
MKVNYLDKFRYKYDDLNELGHIEKSSDEKKKYNSQNLKNLLSSSVKVSESLFPKIAKSIDNVFLRLGIKNNFNFFITANHVETQAACAMMPQSLNAEIIITSKMIELLNSEELESVIAHEISHFYYQHSLYPTIDKARNRTEYLNFLHLSRAAEISADRAGLLGSGNIENSLRAMLKISTGLGDEHISFNFSSYLDQLRELKELKGNQNLLYSTHPTFLNRMQALIWFSMSNEYNDFFKTDKKGVYDLKTVDEKINESIKKVTGNELEVSNKEVINKALLWGSLSIYLADKKFSKEEQEKFEKRFGEKTTVSIKSLLNISKMSVIEKRMEEAFKEAEILMTSDKKKIASVLKEIYSESDNHNEEAKSILSKLVSRLKVN